ncbi:MAG: hypothetical protein ACJ73E_02400 [Mycobacteriales bacterium]
MVDRSLARCGAACDKASSWLRPGCRRRAARRLHPPAAAPQLRRPPRAEGRSGADGRDSQGTGRRAGPGVDAAHEHVFVLSTEHVQNYGAGAWWDEGVRVADAVAKLRALAAKGIRTILDPTVWGLGRYIPRPPRPPSSTAGCGPATSPASTRTAASTSSTEPKT